MALIDWRWAVRTPRTGLFVTWPRREITSRSWSSWNPVYWTWKTYTARPLYMWPPLSGVSGRRPLDVVSGRGRVIYLYRDQCSRCSNNRGCHI